MTTEDVAQWLEQHGEPVMAWTVRQQARQLAESRSAAQSTLKAYYALRDKYEPQQHIPEDYSTQERLD